jgi:hypothetical protein
VALLAALAIGANTRADAQQQHVPDPSEFLEIHVGADSVLADWSQIGRYLSALAHASDQVRLDTVGRSTTGKPMLLVTITAPDHHRRLSEIRDGQALLADPRRLSPTVEDSLVRHAPAVVFINNNIHSTEIASSQFSMILAHRLATDPRYRAILENLIILMTPSANPDGLDTVVAWYRRHKGTPYEAGPLPWLYHPYVGHDNNRDWFMLTQVESQTLARVLYREWFPQVVWDVHQMGNRGARLFVPPFSDPVNPNIDPMIIAGTNLVGSAMAASVIDGGKTGIQHQSRFDLWWHGGFRTVPARHNMIGVLSEAASARLASPIYQDPDSLRHGEAGVNYPSRWSGGWWRLRDIIEYELLAADGLLRLVASERESFVRRFVTLGRRAVAAGALGDPYAYVIPTEQDDPGAAAELANTLLRAGVEIRRATAGFDAGAEHYGAGALIVPMAQPFRAHAKDLLERQRYPDRREYPDGPPIPPYDVAGWTLQLQMGVTVRRVDKPVAVPSVRVEDVEVPAGARHGTGPLWVLRNRSVAESRTVAEALRSGAQVWVTSEPMVTGGTTHPAGSVVLENRDRPDRLSQLIARHVQQFGYDAWAVDAAPPPRLVTKRLPRIALYKPWTASMDEGWTRWVFERHGIPYQSVSDIDIRRGELGQRFDVLLLPDLTTDDILEGHPASQIPAQFAGGIGTAGADNIKDFVHAGGVLVSLDGSSEFAIAWLDLPVANTIPQGRGASTGEEFYAPGSVFEASFETGDALTSGVRNPTYVYFARSVAFDAESPARVLGRYVDEPLRSGYALNQQRLAGRAALVDVPVGDGRVILFGFRPQHRGQPWGTFKLLFNAALLSTPVAR